MAPPMTLQQWIIWNKMNKAHEALQNATTVTDQQKEQIILEIQNEEIQPTRKDRFKYLLYTCCATSTRVLAWIFLVCILLIIVLVSCFVTISRIQWNKDIQVLGPVIDWNVTQRAVYQPLQTRRIARSLRMQHPVPKYVEVNMTSIPQGVYYEPHPEPIVVTERVLGLSQVLMINSENIANNANLTQEVKKLLTEMVNEEMQSLSDVMIDFEIPLGDPRDQEQYIHRKCYQEFAHCYLVKYKEPKPWPKDGLIADQCPLPSLHGTSPYPYQAIWDYYAKVENIRPEKWTSKQKYGDARIGSFFIPKRIRNRNVTHVLFCSDIMYSKWFNNLNTLQQNEVELTKRLSNLTNGNKLKNRALPSEWANGGLNRLFRNSTLLDICNKPEMIILLNKTYFSFSLWEGDCNITKDTIDDKVPECKNHSKNKRNDHPYACRFWRYKEGEEEVKCLTADKQRCLYYPEYSNPEALFDFGFLASQRNFPAPICIEQQQIRDQDYEVYSLYQECKIASKVHGIDTVLFSLKNFLNYTGTPVNEMPNARAFVGLVDPKFPPSYPNVTREHYTSCNNRKRRSVDNNYAKLRSMGYALTGAVQTLSQISDINDEKLQQGIYLLRDHVITLMEATLHDISVMEGMFAVQHLHTHLNHLKTMLLERRIDWTYMSSTWLQQQLQKSDDEMKVIKRIARSLVYYVKQTHNSPTATAWEIGLYYELVIPKHIYLNNWNVVNIGHLVRSAGQLTHITIAHPYEIINKECVDTVYLHLEDCKRQDYVICDVVKIVQPCGNSSDTSDCPVWAEAVKEPFVQVNPLKNGSYLVLASSTDCQIPPYVPSIVTVNETTSCYGLDFKRPLVAEERLSFEPRLPNLQLRLPHLVGIIAKIKGIKIEVTSSGENIKEQIERAKAELLRLDIHEGDTPAWIQQLAAATRDVWPAAASALQGIGNFLSGAAQGIFGTAFSILGYLKPILIGVGVILLIILIFKIVSWIPTKKKNQ
uniref:Envelope glycoprotein gp130 n=1 Tax=Simian foamy virus TaxID=11642 RepID=A0A0P0CW83_9RETR|nr:envelope protein [Simian foamy virus]ALJ11215.1 envelope protein [Simian foamy virus]